MTKSIYILLVALVVLSSANPIDKVKDIFKNDKCVVDQLDAIRPRIEQNINTLKANKDDIIAKAALVSLARHLQSKFESCGTIAKAQPKLKDSVEAAGIGFLLASNCFKDVGAALLVADDVIQDPSDITNDVIIAIVVGILGYQGYKDCSQFVNFIIG